MSAAQVRNEKFKRRRSQIIDVDEVAKTDPDIASFVLKTGYFEKWQEQNKNALMGSLKSSTVVTGKNIQEQGQPFEDMYFILSGTAKCLAQPYHHKQQYPHLYSPLPLNAEEQAVFSAMDFDRFRDMGIPSIKTSDSDNPGKRLSVKQCHRLHHMSKRQALRRIKGYTAAEGYELNKYQELCIVGPGEVIGDTEMLLGLPTVIFSYLSLTDCRILSLSIAAFEKIFKKNERTVELFRMTAEMKLLNRLRTVPGIQCPILAVLIKQLADIAPDKKFKATKKLSNIGKKPEEDEKVMIDRLVLELTPGHWKRSPDLTVNQKEGLDDGLKRVVKDNAKLYKTLKKTKVIKLDDKMWS